MDDLNLEIDLQRGVVPISKAASSLAALIKRATINHGPIVVTQKGRPTGVILPVEVFSAIKNQLEATTQPTPNLPA